MKRLIAVTCLLLVLIVIVIVWAYVNARKKNAIMIKNIREQERNREIERIQIQEIKDAEELSQLELGRKIVDYMKSSYCYLMADYGRNMIASDLNITDRQMTICVGKRRTCIILCLSKDIGESKEKESNVNDSM